ncbi:MAG: ATP-binding protein [Pseudomonadota bacterium]
MMKAWLLLELAIMKIQSLMNQSGEWRPIEVEVSLRKGIAAIKFLGLPDAIAKESVERLKPAFSSLGLPWPNSKIVTINLRPTYLKKTSKGLDLPIALGILAEMGASEELQIDPSKYYYGEVDLGGKLHVPEDLKRFLPLNGDTTVVTGEGDDEFHCSTERWSALNKFGGSRSVEAKAVEKDFVRPEAGDFCFSEKTAKVLQILAAGEHHALLAGPAGSGKSTLAQVLGSILRSPKELEARSIQRVQSHFGKAESWRPVVCPHHTTPMISMLGGGVPLRPGELTRAHGGMLVLDELLEFEPHVLEALREPVELGFMTIARKGQSKKFPAQFQLLATTNLCPCGAYVPGKSNNCRYSLRKCRSTLERLSGPLLDRFDILAFSDQWADEKLVSTGELFAKLKEVYKFQAARGGRLNRNLEVKDIQRQMHKDVEVVGLPGVGMSQRRKRALFRVSRTLADLEFSNIIDLHHIQEAYNYTMGSFTDLEKV